MTAPRRVLDLALLAAIVGLTLATAYIHFWVCLLYTSDAADE